LENSTAKSVYIARLVTLILFIFYPFSSFFISILLLANNYDRKFNQLIFGLFMGLFGYTFIPGREFDIVQHYALFESFLNTSFSEFLVLLTYNNQPDFILYTLYWIVGKVIDNSQIVGFIGAFSFYYLFVLIIDNIFKNYLPGKRNFRSYMLLFFMFMACTVPYIFSGMRNGNAVMLFIFLLTNKDGKRPYVKDILILLLPGLVHFSLFPISIVYLLSKYLNKRIYFIFCSVLILLTPFTLSILTYLHDVFKTMGGIGNFFASKIESYVFLDKNFGMYFGAGFRYYLVELPLFFLTPLLWKYADREKRTSKSEEVLHKFVLAFFAYSLCTIQTFLFARNHMVFAYIYISYWLILYFSKGVDLSVKQGILLFSGFIIISIIPSWIMGQEYVVINSKLFYSSLYELLNTKVTENQYW